MLPDRPRTAMLYALIVVASVVGWAVARGDAPGTRPQSESVSAVSVEQLRSLIDTGTAVHVFDANPRDSYLEAHIPGARWVVYDDVGPAVLPPARDAMLVFYCYNPRCGASHVAARAARALGYRNSRVMADGIAGWKAAHLPTVQGPEPR